MALFTSSTLFTSPDVMFCDNGGCYTPKRNVARFAAITCFPQSLRCSPFFARCEKLMFVCSMCGIRDRLILTLRFPRMTLARLLSHLVVGNERNTCVFGDISFTCLYRDVNFSMTSSEVHEVQLLVPTCNNANSGFPFRLLPHV